ncbi:hypothetical protein I4U23_003247 [Adineta vaga]|nr:hypothetical protein I4U23_003247 [Adineta vaga]
MVDSYEQTAEELYHYVRIENLPYGITAKDITSFFGIYGRVQRLFLKRRVAKDSQVLLTNPKVTLVFPNPESVDEIMASRPLVLGDCKLFIRRCLPLSQRYPLEAFITVTKILIRTKAENQHDILPDDTTIVNYLSQTGGKIEYFERLNDKTILVQFDDYDTVDYCCLSRPHFIGDQEIEIEKCTNEELARISIETQQKLNSDSIPTDTDSGVMDTISPILTLSIDDQMNQLRASYNHTTKTLECEHEQLIASLSAQWEQTAKERIRLQRLTIDGKHECERLTNENRQYQKLYSESLKEKPNVQTEGEGKLSDAYQKTKIIQEKYEQLIQNNRQ